MKFKLLALITVLSGLVFGASVDTKKITASGGSPVPIAYSTDSQSLVLNGITGRANLIVINDTLSRIAIHVDQATIIVPSNDVRDVYIPASTAVAMDQLSIGQRVYLRSDSGSPITAGQIMFVAW